MYTSEIANIVGLHPNSIRLYEEWGFLPSVPRNPSGYRIYTQLHLDHLKLARLAIYETLPRHELQESALWVVKQAAKGDYLGALALAYTHLEKVQAEYHQATATVQCVRHWIEDESRTESNGGCLSISKAAALLGLTPDTLRNWERDGLLKIPRDRQTGYRCYGQYEIERLEVIRMLRQAGYSTMAILRMMRFLDHDPTNDVVSILDVLCPGEELYSASDQWLSSLQELEIRAEAMIKQLEQMIAEQLYEI